MRSATTVLTVALTIVAASAMAPAAGADPVPLSTHEESTTSVCDPCTFEASGESRLVALPSGVTVGTCSDTYSGSIGSDGSGEMQWSGSSDGGTGCNATNCVSGDESHWPMSDAAIVGAGVFDAAVRLCVRAGVTEVHCNAHVQISAAGGVHAYGFAISQLCAGGARRIEASGHLEAVNGIEVTEAEE